MQKTQNTQPKANATAEVRGVAAQRGALGRSLAATTEARDVGIGRYELIRQRNKAEAQRDELLAAAKALIASVDAGDTKLNLVESAHIRAAIANAEK